MPLLVLFFSKDKTKFVLRISGLPKLNFFRKLLWKSISKKIFLVTCPTNQTKNDLLKLKIFPANKIKVLFDPIIEVKEISKDIKKRFSNTF